MILVAAAALSLALASTAKAVPSSPGVAEEKITVPLFGKVAIYRPEPIRRARGVVLFISGDGGWNKGVVDMARRIAPHAIVAGLSMPVWQKAVEHSDVRCWFAAGELEEIAKAIEKTYRLPRYVPSVLVGYSSGATAVYGALAQAPPGTFAGAVSLGFCPDLEVARPLCGRGDWKPPYDTKKHRSDLPAKPDLETGEGGRPVWIALQGDVDQVCDPGGTVKFVGGIPAAKVVSLAKVGHGFAVPRNWGNAFDESVTTMLETGSVMEPSAAREAVAAPPAPSAATVEQRLTALDLPLSVSWPESARAVLVFVSGDGGWAELDRKVAEGLHSRGIAVVGWNALRYFWEEKTPDRFRADLARVVDTLPEGIPVFAGGYSFGAEVVPAALAERSASPLPSLSRVAGLVLLAPGPYATFEVSPLDWIRSSSSPTRHPVRSAIEGETAVPVLCLEPGEGETGCPPPAASGRVRAERLPGGHHFGGDFSGLVERVASFVTEAKPAPVSAAKGSS